MAHIFTWAGQSYTEILDMMKNLIVQSEVIAGNDINACLLLDIPVLEAESLCLGEKVGLGDLSAPVSFGGFLQITVHSHAGETENRSTGIIVNMLCLT